MNDKYLKASLLLPDEIINSLSLEAVRAYEKLWNLARKRARNDVWISDSALSITARVDFDSIPQLKYELETSGLLQLTQGKWPADDPPNICHKYQFVIQD